MIRNIKAAACYPYASQVWCYVVFSLSLQNNGVFSPGCPTFLPLILLLKSRVQAVHSPGRTEYNLLTQSQKSGNQGNENLHPAANSSSTSRSLSSALAFGLLMSFSTSSSPCSCGESITFRDLASGCGVREKHGKDVFAPNVPFCRAGTELVCQVSTVLPETLRLKNNLNTVYNNTMCFSLEQSPKHTTVSFAFRFLSLSRKDKALGNDLTRG